MTALEVTHEREPFLDHIRFQAGHPPGVNDVAGPVLTMYYIGGSNSAGLAFLFKFGHDGRLELFESSFQAASLTSSEKSLGAASRRS